MSALIVPNYVELAERIRPEREQGRSIALANGCFDILHVGHVRLLTDARLEADILIIALNHDESIRVSKGDGRPYVPLAERMEVVAALSGIDFVTSFGEKTADELIGTLRPDVQIKGTDWSASTVPERAAVEAYGGRIAICGDVKGHSSSQLVERIRGD